MSHGWAKGRVTLCTQETYRVMGRGSYIGTQRTGPITQSTTFPKGWSVGQELCGRSGHCENFEPRGFSKSAWLCTAMTQEEGRWSQILAPIKNCHADSFLGLTFMNHPPTEFHPTGLPRPCTASRTSFSHSPFRPRRNLVFLRMESLSGRVGAGPRQHLVSWRARQRP